MNAEALLSLVDHYAGFQDRIHDASFVALDAAIREVCAERDRLRDIILGLYKIELEHDTAKRSGDWACVECKTHSHMLIEGFRCAYQ
jgi:hypothetical protein